jgi:diguanylate cyclase (GGDEF)-like protein/PAS domain S-box-containing protein
MARLSKPALSLRRSLQIRVGILVSGAVLLVGLGGIALALRPMMGRIAETQFALAASQVKASLDRVFEPPEQILLMSRRWIGDNPPTTDDPETFGRFFRPVLQTLPQATSIVAGTSSGEGWMVLQQGDGRWLERTTDRPRWNDRHLFVAQEPNGERRQYWQSVDYDPRRRSWYEGALRDRNTVQWTKPYTFFTTGDPGITASVHIPLKEQRDFVLGIDLKLRDLSAMTMEARIGEHGMALVLTDDLRALALPAPAGGIDRAAWLGKILEPATELGLAPLNDALANSSAFGQGDVVSFRSSGAQWLVRVQPYLLGKSRLWVVTLAPASEFSPGWVSVAGFLIGGTAAMLLLAIFFARQQARRIARPLEALTEASERIGQLDFQGMPLEASQIAEVGQLAAAHERMRVLLLNNQQQIAAQENELRSQIDALRAAEEKISESEAYNKLLFANTRIPLVVLDPESGRFVDCNLAAAQISRLDTVDDLIGLTPADVSAPFQYDGTPSAEAAVLRIRQAMSHGVAVFEWRSRRRDGSEWDAELHLMPYRHSGRLLLHFSLQDITERKRSEEKLVLAASVFTHAREGIMITTADGTIIDVNDSFSRITLYEHDEVLGRNPHLLSSGRHRGEFYKALWSDLTQKGHWYGEIWNRRKNGELYAAMLTISEVCDTQGHIRHYVALFSDITTLKAHQKQLEHIAHYDALTTLPNRVLLADRLHQAMAQGPRRGRLLAVAYLDLDGFKVINDTHGHEVGDQLLVALANRMKQTLREGDTLARLGGDEFVAVMLDLSDVADCIPMLSRLLAAAAQPTTVDEHRLQVSASLGVTFYPQADEVDADQLLRQADQAMYQAKQTGKNRYHIFDAEQDRSVRGRHESLEHIRRALNEKEFVLHYQPKVNMRTGTVIGAEALIRWQHPERGILPPAVFLPVIEDHPLAVDIGEWVIATALAQMADWHARGLDIPVSVNVGARQLQRADFVDRVRGLLAACPSFKAGDLEMEVLETSALEDLDRVAQVIESCREIGVSFALDDFGTGYSSLTYLKRLSATQLKIDQSFVRDMLDDPDDLAILGGVLSLATAFRRQVIAEGVETIEHGTMLLQLGCELAQGYGIARPMPAAELPQWVATWRPDSAWSNLPPVSRDDLPLLFAGVEHRAWIVAIGAFLKGEREQLPLIHHQCRFADWLEGEGQRHHGTNSAFQDARRLHQQLHLQASELCERYSADSRTETQAQFAELHQLLDAMLGQIRQLVRHSRPS